jgi:hypothetical protein
MFSAFRVAAISVAAPGLSATLALPMQAVGAPIATTTTVSLTQTTASVGDAFTLTATVVPAVGSGSPTGTVQMIEGSTPLGPSLVFGRGGTVSLNEIANAVGTFSFRAAYSGDANLEGSTSNPVVLMVLSSAAPAPEPSSIALVLSGIAGLLVLPAATGLGMVRRTPTSRQLTRLAITPEERSLLNKRRGDDVR